MDDVIEIDNFTFEYDVHALIVYNDIEVLFRVEDRELANLIYYLVKKYKESMIIQGESHLDSLLRTARENNITLTGEDYWKLVDSLIESGYTVCGKIKKTGDIE